MGNRCYECQSSCLEKQEGLSGVSSGESPVEDLRFRSQPISGIARDLCSVRRYTEVSHQPFDLVVILPEVLLHRDSMMRRSPMGHSIARRQLTGIFLLLIASGAQRVFADDEALRFNRDVRPILANHCYQCHGPDSQSRRGGLRLDRRELAIAAAESGEAAIVPGNAGRSQLVERIQSHDSSIIMPPPAVAKPLTDDQKKLLIRWIEQGAPYEPHWSFMAPKRPTVPSTNQPTWVRNEIDAFVLKRIETAGLLPSPEADLQTLIRRLSLDLTGLPPSPADVAAFVQEMTDAIRDSSEHAQRDATYAKWVKQLLDSPHYGERMAVDWLDVARFADSNGYQVDRDREISAWRDWVINAFNANMPFDQFTIEQIAGDLLPDASLSQKIATGFHRNHMLNEEGGVIPEEFLAEYCADRVETTAAVWLGQTFNCARCHDHKFDPFTQRDFYSLYAFFHNVTEKGIGKYGTSIRHSAPPFLKLPAPEIEKQIESLKPQITEAQQALSTIDSQLVAEQATWEAELRTRMSDQTGEPPETPPVVSDPVIAAILLTEPSRRTDGDKSKLSDFQKATHPGRKTASERHAALTKQSEDLELQIPTTLVMEEMPEPRVTQILIRGVYDKLGDVVTADIPASLPPMSPEWPRNRLGLARWLVAPSNPLTARVTVNRVWQSLFGTGLVRTSEDFGTQGEAPSHPELLDWLADEFVQSGWNVKHLLTLIVSSSTYRQRSMMTARLRELDPENRLLARGPRFRLQSEFVRDQALAASGLLVRKIGGPSVKPYHPPGLYEQVTAGSGTNVYTEGQGDDLHRRSMYTYWKRSVPNPAMLVFDSPFREACTVRRARTNTPLQALNLMNDPTYVESARFLAGRMLNEAASNPAAQISLGFRLVLARPPQATELEILTRAFQRTLNEFEQDTAAATALLQIGAARSPEQRNPAQLAAMTVVASTILNLDEAVMKE